MELDVVKPIWKLISVIIGLIAFIGVAVAVYMTGEDLLWVVIKAIGSFFVCWIVLGNLGIWLIALLEKQDRDVDENIDAEIAEVAVEGSKRG